MKSSCSIHSPALRCIIGWSTVLVGVLLLAAPVLADAPDLRVTAVGVQGDQAVEAASLRLTAVVSNAGQVATPAGTTVAVTFVDVTGNGRKSITYSSTFKGPLAPGETKTVVADGDWSPLAGTYAIQAIADDVNRIKESDETNNTHTGQIVVAPNADLQAILTGPAAPAAPPASELEAVPNGSFDEAPTNPKVESQWAKLPSHTVDKSRALWLRKNEVLDFDARGKLMWDAEYVVSFDVRTLNFRGREDANAQARAVLWARLPDQHEPPEGGWISVGSWNGTSDWKRIEKRFRMPRGVSRFVLYLDTPQQASGLCLIDNISVRPVNDRPLPVSADALGDPTLEQMTWIWSKPGFAWDGGKVGETTTLVLGGHMGKSMNQPTPATSASFKRSITIPADAKDVKAIFVGDDQASLLVNGKPVARNEMWQQIVCVPLDELVRRGEANEIRFDVKNSFGMAGLLARVQWRDAAGVVKHVPTNRQWQCVDSPAADASWSAAHEIAVPAPAPSSFAWVYPHLPRKTYELAFDLPADVRGARVRARVTNGYRIYADDRELLAVESIGHPVAVDLHDGLNVARRVRVAIEEIGLQRPAGNGVLELQLADGAIRLVPFSEFKTTAGASPTTAPGLWPELTWPINAGAFEATVTRPLPQRQGNVEPWTAELLRDGRDLWTVGVDDGSSAEFASIKEGQTKADVSAAPGKLPRGLELRDQPELTLEFQLSAVPEAGAAFVLDVEDADALVTQCAVFINGTMVGMPQLIGYDLIPGGRLTNRQWVVTIPAERLRTGANTLTLRVVPSYYGDDKGAVQNQSEEYIRQLALGERSTNPYPTAQWLHWDHLRLVALAKPTTRPINGRPTWMGLNTGDYMDRDPDQWQSWILRDMEYVGLTGTGAPIRVGAFQKSTLDKYNRTLKTLPPNTTAADWQFNALIERGLKPYLLFEPGRTLREPSQLPTSHEANVIKRYGRYVELLEIGNEVDHPNYGFDAFALAAAYATIQKESAAGNALTPLTQGKSLQLMGQGWYHAWDFSVIDAQARQETPIDPTYTAALSAHSYGTSYIIPAVTY